MKDILWIFWFTFSGVQVSEFVCQRLSVERFRCQRVSNCHSVCLRCFIVFRSCAICLSEVLWFMYWRVSSCLVYFLCQKVLWLESFFVYSLFVRGFGIKWFHWVLVFVFVGLQFVSEGFFRYHSYVCQNFWCLKVAPGLLFWCVRGFKGFFSFSFSEVWVSNNFKVYQT